MTEKQKQFQRDIALAVSIRLGMTISTARNGLETLEKAGLLDDVLCGQKSAIEKAYKLRWEGYTGPKKTKAKVKKHRPKKTSDVQLNDVKIMMWAIEKIGDIVKAEEAFEKAVTVFDGVLDDI